MKRKIVLLAIAGVMASMVIAGESLARMQVNTEETAVIVMNTGNMGLVLNEGNGNMLAKSMTEYTAQGIAPGVWVQAPYSVSNTGDYTVYTRAIVNKYLLDEKGNKIFDGTGNYDSRKIEIDLENVRNLGWIAYIKPGDEEEITFYYDKPLAPGETSPNFVEALRMSARAGNKYANLGMGFSVRVEAVQSERADKAMLAEWGVVPQFVVDASGNVTDILSGIAD